MANFVGLLVLAGFVAIAFALVPASEVHPLLWAALYLAGATFAVFLWNNERSPTSPVGWLVFAAGTFVVGILFFAVDIAFGHFQHSELSLLEAGEKAGGMFGFLVTLCICPGLTAIAIAGFVRAWFVHARTFNA